MCFRQEMALKLVLAVGVLAVVGWPTTTAERVTMAGEAAAALLQIQMMQSVFSSFESTIHFGSSMCPMDVPIENITSKGSYDFIIVGGGTAGLVLANRLSACPSVSVLLLEAGGCPPLESNYLSYFPILSKTKYDYNMTSVNDHYALQNLQGGVAGVTAGRMLGGSNSLQFALSITGGKSHFDLWAKAANDSSWSFSELLPYFIKSQTVLDKDIVEEYGAYHGTFGPTKLKTQPSPKLDNIFKSFEELGFPFSTDANFNNPLGVFNPLLAVDSINRQGGHISYLFPVKDRQNLHVRTGATVTKIIFNDNKVATGVQFSHEGRSYIVNCINEIIVSAGVIKTPQLLMLSGIGPSKHLKSKNITVVSDLPVGKNLQDHIMALIPFGLERDSSPTPPVNPSENPVPTIASTANFDNNTADFVTYQGIHFLFPHDSESLMIACLNLFKYSVPICQKLYDANVGRTLLMSFNIFLRTASRGEVLLNTTDMSDNPLIYLRFLSEKTDVINLGKYLAYIAKLLGTSYFNEIGADIIDLGVCNQYEKCSSKYWECFAVAMSTNVWHFCGTAALGSVVDGQLFVKGVTGLRVVDASIMPIIPDGKLQPYVLAIAEKTADVILDTYEYFCSNEING